MTKKIYQAWRATPPFALKITVSFYDLIDTNNVFMLASFCKFYRLRPGVFLIWWSDKPFSTACNPDRVGGTFLVVNKPFEKTFDIKKTSNIFFSSFQTRHYVFYAMATEREIWSWIKCETRFWLEIGSIAGDKTDVKQRPPLEKKSLSISFWFASPLSACFCLVRLYPLFCLSLFSFGL